MVSFVTLLAAALGVAECVHGAAVQLDRRVTYHWDDKKKCSDKEKLQIETAWDDAATLANVGLTYWGPSNPVWNEYFGSVTDATLANQAKMVLANVVASLASNDAFMISCETSCLSDLLEAAWVDIGAAAATLGGQPQHYYSTNNIHFCPSTLKFGTKRLASPLKTDAESRKAMESFCKDLGVLDPIKNFFQQWRYLSTTLLHELTHTETIAGSLIKSQRQGSDYTKAATTDHCYGKADCKALAARDPLATIQNADTYALYSWYTLKHYWCDAVKAGSNSATQRRDLPEDELSPRSNKKTTATTTTTITTTSQFCLKDKSCVTEPKCASGEVIHIENDKPVCEKSVSCDSSSEAPSEDGKKCIKFDTVTKKASKAPSGTKCASGKISVLKTEVKNLPQYKNLKADSLGFVCIPNPLGAATTSSTKTSTTSTKTSTTSTKTSTHTTATTSPTSGTSKDNKNCKDKKKC